MRRQKDYALDDFCKITNYEKLKPDLDLIAAWAPELVIVDESPRVKTGTTIAARALKRIDSSYCDRAYRDALGKQIGRTDLHRPVLSISNRLGTNLEITARASGQG